MDMQTVDSKACIAGNWYHHIQFYRYTIHRRSCTILIHWYLTHVHPVSNRLWFETYEFGRVKASFDSITPEVFGELQGSPFWDFGEKSLNAYLWMSLYTPMLPFEIRDLSCCCLNEIKSIYGESHVNIALCNGRLIILYQSAGQPGL